MASPGFDDNAGRTHGDLVHLIQEYDACSSDGSGRIDTYQALSRALSALWTQSSDQLALAACIEVETELLALHPPGYSERSERCQSLGTLLRIRSEQIYDVSSSLLDQSISLGREALALRPSGHAERHSSCDELGQALQLHFGRTGEMKYLHEAVELHREALMLRPIGHPDRHRSCHALAVSLTTLHRQTAETTLLDEMIHLARETISLRPLDHPNRAYASIALANSLQTRFEQTGDYELLVEAIHFHQEAVSLRPVGHMKRSIACLNLANSLRAHFMVSSDITVLEQSVQLGREALALASTGDVHRDTACSNLAVSLSLYLQHVADEAVVKEATQLYRDTIQLRPIGHPRRHIALFNFANFILRQRLLRSSEHDAPAVHEITSLVDEALSLCSPEHPDRWRYANLRIDVALYCKDYATMLQELLSMLSLRLHDVPERLEQALDYLQRINPDALLVDNQNLLLEVYAHSLDLMLLATRYAPDLSSQLDRVFKSITIGPGAYMTAIRINELSRGLELLERARGVIWSQMLHIRDPQIERVPQDLAETLVAVLRGIRAPQVTVLQTTSLLSERDLIHEQRSQLERILHSIRSLPGLDDFMCGPGSHTLLATAARNPVVVLVADERECHALVITSPDQPLVDLLLKVDASELKDLVLTNMTLGKRGSVPDSANTHAQRAMRLVRLESKWEVILARLWKCVVKPVLECLGLAVSYVHQFCDRRLTKDARSSNDRVGGDLGFTGAQLAHLHLFPCTRPGSTQPVVVHVAIACRTTSSPHTRLRLPRSCVRNANREVSPRARCG
jgi:hypothetical protein